MFRDGGIQKNNDTYILLDQGDEAKISYFSPRFFGFQVGASYIPELENARGSGNGSNSDPMPNAVGGGGDAWMAILNYKGEFGGVGIAADYGYGRSTGSQLNGSQASGTLRNVNIKSADGHQAGLKLSYAGFEFGGAWQYTNEDHDLIAQTQTTTARNEGSVWEVGVGYSQGPWGVSVGYMVSEQTGIISNQEEDEWKVIAVSGKYNLGPGIDVHGSLYHVDQEDEAKVDSTYNDGGWAVVAGFNLSF